MQRFTLSTDLSHLQMYGPVLFAIGMLLGTLWYFSIDFEPNLLLLFIVTLGLSAFLLWVRQKSAFDVTRIGLVIALGASFGASAGSFASARVQTITIAQETGPVWVEGWIERALPADRGARLELRVHAIDGLAAENTPRHIRLTHRLDLKTEPGRFVRCWSVIRPPPAPVLADDYGFDRQAWYMGLGAVGYVQGRCRGATLGRPAGLVERAENWISVTRRQLARYVKQHAGDRSGGFAAALVSGDRSFMSMVDQEALRGAGLAHLLAISGLHMGIVGGLVFLLTWRVLALIEPVALRVNVKKPAAAAALFSCLVYLVISGASVSTQRAFIMATVLFGAVLIDRTALSLRSLAIAMILILTLLPWSVVTPGFQMSFAATGALIATYERWQRRDREQGFIRRNRILFWVQGLFVTSAVSGFATMPFALYHFGRVAGLGLAANLMAMPIVSLISAPAATAALVLAPIGLDTWALRAFGLSLEAVLGVAHVFAEILPDEQMSVSQMPSESALLLSFGIILYCLIRTPIKAWGGAAALSCLAIVYWSVSFVPQVHWAPSGDVYVEVDHSQVLHKTLLDGAGLPPLRLSDHPLDDMCAPQRTCSVELGQATVTLSPDGQSIRLTLSRDRSSSRAVSPPIEISWADVQSQNGISYVLRDGRFRKIRKLPCGRRPWRPCAPGGDAPIRTSE